MTCSSPDTLFPTGYWLLATDYWQYSHHNPGDRSIANRAQTRYPLPMTDDPNPPGMIGPSPSERGLPAVPTEPVGHAVQFSGYWQDRIEPEAGRIMREVGIPPDRIGGRDIAGGFRLNFFPDERDGGLGVDGGINLDSGIFNPEQMSHLGEETCKAWLHASVQTRVRAVIAHEDREWRAGTHELAVESAPETDLNIGRQARKLLRVIRRGEQGFRGGVCRPLR